MKKLVNRLRKNDVEIGDEIYQDIGNKEMSWTMTFAQICINYNHKPI